ncbi:MAG TPA: hypothetical protein VGB20_02340 [bacterium]
MAKRTKAEELLNFEIAFYEKLVHAYPEFVDALMPLAEAYTRRGFHEKGLEVDLKLIKLKAYDPIVWYNMACSYSLLERIEDAMGALREAVRLGYSDLRHLRHDPDLAKLRQSPEFNGLLTELMQRQPS